ncbi:MAG: hypothetical protein M1818_003013 [Claussenomyces sp. TS43310]|nr:MAG: hypothetical protein M1818_003013 [Claussenomyces sp. TS43310]
MATHRDAITLSPAKVQRASHRKPPAGSGSGDAGEAGPEAERHNGKKQDRIQRKRIQNRISQQCVRERAQAHAKQLEVLTEMVKSTTPNGGDSDTSGQMALMRNQLRLIEENKKLRDALLKLRKKLRSLSAAAASAADDPMLDEVLPVAPSKEKARNMPPDDSKTEVLAHKSNPEGARDAAMLRSAPQNAEAPFMDCHDMAPSDLTWLDNLSHSLEGEGTLEACPPPHTTCEDKAFAVPAEHMTMLNAVQAAGSNFQNEMLSDKKLTSNDPSALMGMDHLWPEGQQMQPWIPFSSQPSSEYLLSGSSQFSSRLVSQSAGVSFVVAQHSQTIESACITYLANRVTGISKDQGQSRSCENLNRLDSHRSALASSSLRPNVVLEVAKGGVYLMGRLQGYSPYMYGIGANEVMEKVLRWRISPSLDNRIAIPEPFRPTPLQMMTMNHPNVIDFVNWPSIRDQLIFKLGTFDLDKMIADIVLNTVIEIPQFQVAVNVHDTFITRISNYPSLPSDHGPPPREFGPSQGPTDSYQGLPPTAREVIESLAHELPSNTVERLNLRAASHNQSWFRRHQLATRWGLDRLVSWKLSKEFAMAHPEIDCASGES